jgi:glycolate oxidase iron-sulfur subunit
MQTNLAEPFKNTPEGEEAAAIVRTCVHCGFCLATCPTYQLLGDELDSPRGRIYLMKQMLEGAPVTEKTQLHLDRCLTCRSCETTCPSGVKYGRLVDIGRGLVESRVKRGMMDTLKREALRQTLPRSNLFRPLLKLSQLARPALPSALQAKLPAAQAESAWPAPRHARKMVVLDGCVQPSLAPNINAAAARVLDRLGISLVRADAGCCGALAYHLNAHQDGLGYMRRAIDAWWPHLTRGAEAVAITASGCGAMVTEYGHLLSRDSAYAAKAAEVSARMKDIGEIVAAEHERLEALLANTGATKPRRKIAFHSPCSLQHGLKIRNSIEPLLARAGFDLTFVPDAHLCCGSAGTYSILQPELAQRLLKNKVKALETGAPELIATANIGCMTHIQSGTGKRVKHWIELLDERLG